MAIVRLQPDANIHPNHTTPDSINETSRSVFTPLVPDVKINSLLKYAEGYPWTVNYYGQIVNKDNTLENFDPTTPNLTQPYYKVINLILQVDSPLSSSYDSSTGITTVTGSAIAPYKITPNVGDVFLAQVDTGEDAIFHINAVTRKTHRKDTLYEIAYSLYAYVSTEPSFIPTLEQRVNDSYYFNKDTNFFNRDVLVTPSTKEATDRLKIFLHESKQYYFSTFTNNANGTLVIPGVDDTVYDPLLVSFILKTVEYDYLVNTPLHQHTYVSTPLQQPSIFNAILSRTLSAIPTINKTYTFIPSNLIPNLSRLVTLYHAGMHYILHPTNPDKRVEIEEFSLFESSSIFSTLKTAKNYTGTNSNIVQTTNNNSTYSKVLLHELFEDDYYVVSKHFYDYVDDKMLYVDISYIELLLYKFLKKDAISREDLSVAVKNYHTWPLLHQIYLLPVLWVLVGASIK